jgi:hypothetical protein
MDARVKPAHDEAAPPQVGGTKKAPAGQGGRFNCVSYSPCWNVGSRMIGAAGNPGTAGANPMTDPNAVPAGMTEVTPPTVNVSGAEVTVG